MNGGKKYLWKTVGISLDEGYCKWWLVAVSGGYGDEGNKNLTVAAVGGGARRLKL